MKKTFYQNSRTTGRKENTTHLFYPFLFFMGLFFFTACENDINEVNRLFSDRETQIETALGVEMLYSDSARLTLRITTPKLVRHIGGKEPWQEFPNGLAIEFFDKKGKEVTARMSAKYARRYDDQALFIVRDSVVWYGEKGEKLETGELVWNEEEEKVHTDKFVIVSRPGEIIYGHGFESNIDFTKWKIRAIEGRIKSKIADELKD